MSCQIVRRTLGRWIVTVSLALCPLVSHALGLGKLEVKSRLDQPLDAEINFTSISDSELKGLSVSLAPRSDFDAAGAQWVPMLSQIKFIVAKRPDGHYYVHLKTEEPINEPFLHLLLQVEWTGGRLVREYTALIDPPSYVMGKPPAVESPQVASPPMAPAMAPKEPSSAKVENVPPPPPPPTAPAMAPKEPASAKVENVPPPPPAQGESEPKMSTSTPPMPESQAARPAEPQPGPQAGETQEVAISAPTKSKSEQPAVPVAHQGNQWSNTVEYTVRPGDTLWHIAERLRADKQLSLQQVILAIFRNNPNAFFRNNVNNVYAGKVLKIPELDAVKATSASEARQEFRIQYSAWKEYKRQLAERSRSLKVEGSAAKPAASKSAPAKTEVAEKKTQEKTAQEKTTKKGAPTTAETSKQSGELLKIVRATDETKKQAGEKGAETESANADGARERTALAERVATLDESLESKRLENRELSEKVGEVRAQIKNEKRLIQLENQALAQQTGKPAEAKPETAKPEQQAKPMPAPAAASAKPEKKPETAPPPRAKPVKTPPRRRVVRHPLPATPPQKGFIQSLLDTVTDPSILPLVGGGGIILVGGAILIVYMRRRRRSIAEFEESILASDAIPTEAAPTSAETTGQSTTGDTSFLSDFSKGGMGQVHTDDVDPIAEAEVYLAYGRDETAEEILKEAIVKNPERHELKEKLLEIYSQRNDVNAFETLAEELYAAIGGRGGKIWEKVEEMGRKLNPENPMFRGGAPAPRATDTGELTAPTPGVGVGSAASALDGGAMGGSTAATQVVENPSSVDFDFNIDSEAPAESSHGLDMKTEPVSAGHEAQSGGAAGSLDDLKGLTLDSPADNVIDFDGSKGGSSESISFEADATPAAGGNDIKWELDTPESAAPEAATEDKAESGNGADEHWDETATKLDLAKAYIDMGDAEGARSILDEVLAEGNDQQKKQAAELAAQIA